MKIEIDTSELRTLVADLMAAPAEARDGIRSGVAEAAKEVESAMRDEMSKSGSFGHLAGGIDHDLFESGMAAEIGPSKKYTGQRRAPRRGANIAYFGTSKGGGTVEPPEVTLARFEEPFAQLLADAVEDAF